MLINEELKRIQDRFRRPEPAPVENFTSVLGPLKSYQPVKSLCHFDLMVHKKKEQPPFKNGKWTMTHRGDKYGHEDRGLMLEKLTDIIAKHYALHTLMVLYDNSLPGDRCDRQIFKLSYNKVELNRLCEYSDIIKKALPEWMSIEVKTKQHETTPLPSIS